VDHQELCAALEELEVHRHELQSMNDELTAVNQELGINLNELARANNDLRNLMDATAIPTVFLDRKLRIMRFTPSATCLFRLIPSDVGRPLADLRHDLDYPALLEDLQRVLAKSEPLATEVRDTAGHWFVARVLLYRTSEQRVAGLVLTFYDITERKRAEAEVQARNEELERFNRVTVGRELRMIELKKEINALRTQRGEPARYALAFEANGHGEPNPKSGAGG
jgi:two-component system CheB/CheR fusion protein